MLGGCFFACLSTVALVLVLAVSTFGLAVVCLGAKFVCGFIGGPDI